MRSTKRFSSLLMLLNLSLLFIWGTAAAAESNEAFVKGSLLRGEERIELEGVAVLREGPVVVFLLTNEPIPEGRAQGYANDLLEGTGLVGIKLGIPEPGSELSEDVRGPLFVQFLPGDGSLRFDSGPTPAYQFEPATMTAEHVAGRIHGTVVATPELIDVDVSFGSPIQ